MSRKKWLDPQLVSSLIRKNYSLSEIGKIVGSDRQAIWKRMKEWGFQFHEIKFDHRFFREINTEHKAYWLGYMMADGCVTLTQSNRVEICSKDKEHLLKWHKALLSSHNVHILRNKDGVYWKSTHVSKEMVGDLSKHGVSPRKSLTLEFPDTVPDYLMNHFFRGYFDGDFTIGIDNERGRTPYLIFHMIGTKDFITKSRDYFKLSNMVQKRGNIYRVQTSGNIKVRKIMDWLYKDATIYLNRKKEKYEGYKEIIFAEMKKRNFKKMRKETKILWMAA